MTMVERAAVAIRAVRPRSRDDDVAMLYARAALLAALDPEDEALVEAVARAQCLTLGLHADDWSEDPCGGTRTFVWQKESDTARAAIAALKKHVQGETVD